MAKSGAVYQELGKTRERGRAAGNGNSLLIAWFGFDIDEYRNSKYHTKVETRWENLRPEFGMPTSGRLGIRLRVLRALPGRGTVTAEVSRDGPGPSLQPQEATRRAEGETEEIRAAFRKMDPVYILPPNIASGCPPVLESVTARVKWTPDGDAPTKELVESVRVRWYRSRAGRFIVYGPDVVGKKRDTHMRLWSKAAFLPDELYGLRYEIFWDIDNPSACCGTDQSYAVIQFMRHHWDVKGEKKPSSEKGEKESGGEEEKKESKGTDAWKLDIRDSEVPTEDRKVYDPTYTRNPRGKHPDEEPVVFVIPNGKGTAILQYDRPGFSKDLYDRLSNFGGEFAWELHSLLVCEIENGDAKAYREKGLVEQEMRWKVTIRFPGGGGDPETIGRIEKGYPKRRKKKEDCRGLLAVLNERGLLTAFNNPRRHKEELVDEGK